MAYTFLHGPYNLTTIVIGLIVDNSWDYSFVIRTDVVISSLAIVVDPILYVWRYTDCRIQMMMLLCHCNPAQRDKWRRKTKLILRYLRDQYRYEKFKCKLIRNIATNVASMFTRTCRLFFLSSWRYFDCPDVIKICGQLWSQEQPYNQFWASFPKIYRFQQAKPIRKLTIQIALARWNRKI